MSTIVRLVFNPFQENTYVVYDETGECIIIDPGCSTHQEEQELLKVIEDNKLKPVALVLTHAHIDHIMGNKFVVDQFNIPIIMNRLELDSLQAAPNYGQHFGVTVEPSPEPSEFIDESDPLTFGNTRFKVLFTPGHSAGGLSYYNVEEQYVIVGDCLFLGSIGRTDLPGGDYNTLITTIEEEFLVLDDEVTVYSGHGIDTTIGFERHNNPFLRG